HTGRYLAERLFECLQRYGLTKFILSLCMDNATNCDTLAVELAKLVPSFLGKKARTRCF
ncbi:hypothetical protein K488DRAFT_10552, partial [Vararia minispora EC-137]